MTSKTSKPTTPVTKKANLENAKPDDGEGMAKYAVSPDTLTKEATLGAEDPADDKKDD
jgi:hypothetical protein